MFSRKVDPADKNTNEPAGPYQLNETAEDDNYEEEEENNTKDLFKEGKVRAKFVRKVYSMLTAQMLFTMLFVTPFLYLDDVQEFVYDYPHAVYIFTAIMVTPYMILVCCEDLRRSFPKNIILLSIMTIGMSGVCGCMTAKLNTEVVLYALFLTILVTLSITFLAVFCPIDFTKFYMIICGITFVLFIFGLILVGVSIITDNKIVKIIYSGIFVIIFSLFLLFDTQAIIGGRRISLRPEEYILGTVQLYVDIIEVFLNFLEIIGTCSENDS